MKYYINPYHLFACICFLGPECNYRVWMLNHKSPQWALLFFLAILPVFLVEANEVLPPVCARTVRPLNQRASRGALPAQLQPRSWPGERVVTAHLFEAAGSGLHDKVQDNSVRDPLSAFNQQSTYHCFFFHCTVYTTTGRVMTSRSMATITIPARCKAQHGRIKRPVNNMCLIPLR